MAHKEIMHMDRTQIILEAKLLHRFMLHHRNPRYALPRLGLALDLASLKVAGDPDIADRGLSLERITRFVERNA